MSENISWRDPALGTSRVLDLGNGRVRVFEAGDGAPIVFVHGLGVNANLWRKVVPLLAPEFRCVAIDLPLGSHTLPVPDADLSPPGLANLIADAIEALGFESVTLVANDTGGALCHIVITRRPERVDALVLTSCESRGPVPPRIFNYMKVAARIPGALRLLTLTMRVPALRRLPFAYGWLAKRPIDRQAEDSYALAGLAAPGVLADAKRVLRSLHRRYTNEAADLLGNFDRPTLIAWSTEDRFFKREPETLLRDLPNARLEWIDDAFSFSPEDQPERLAELIGSFVHESRPGAPVAKQPRDRFDHPATEGLSP